MDFDGAIFDLDGTLLDSMDIWLTVGERYLTSKGVTPRGNVHEAIATFNMTQSAEYFQDEYGITDSVPEIIIGVEKLLEDFYAHEAELLPGAGEFLDQLGARGIERCIATTTDRHLVEAALQNNGILDDFAFIQTCSELRTDKEHPKIFLESCKRLGTSQEDTWVFEDAVHAIRTAKDAGFHVCAIEDESMELYRDEICSMADVYLKDFRDWKW